MRCNPSAASAWFGQVFKASASNTQAWVRTYIYVATLPSAATEFVGLWNAGGATRQASLFIDNTGVITLRDSAGTTKVTSSAISTGTQVCVEFTTNANGGAATMELVIDGVSAGTSNTGNVGNFDACYWGTPSGAGTYDIYFDDLAINDSAAGGDQTAFPSTTDAWRATQGGKIIHLRPNAQGDNNGWLKQGGGAGSSTNYQDVDETTPDDATTYVKRTSGTPTDDHGVDDPAIPAIYPGATVTLVAVGQRAGATSTTATARTNILRIKKTASGTVSESASLPLNVNGWLTHRVTVPKNYMLTRYTDPDSANWTWDTLTTMQIGFRANTSSTNEIRVSTLWALVEYVNGKSPAPGIFKRRLATWNKPMRMY